MEFLLYLDWQGHQIIQDMISARFHIHENVGLCSNRDILGYAESSPRKFVVCTENIRNNGLDPRHYIPETVYHEGIHASQFCNNDRPLGVALKTMPLSADKLKDVVQSVKYSKGKDLQSREHEAYFFEDKPGTVREFIRRFCF